MWCGTGRSRSLSRSRLRAAADWRRRRRRGGDSREGMDESQRRAISETGVRDGAGRGRVTCPAPHTIAIRLARRVSPTRRSRCGRAHLPARSLEVLFYLSSRQSEHHRPSMRTHRRMRRPPQLVEQVLHLLARERVVRLDRGVAGHRRGQAAQARRRSPAPGARPSRSAATARSAASLRVQSRSAGTAATRRLDAAEVFDLEAEPAERGAVREQRLVLASADLEHDRRQQPLRFERAAR